MALCGEMTCRDQVACRLRIATQKEAGFAPASTIEFGSTATESGLAE